MATHSLQERLQSGESARRRAQAARRFGETAQRRAAIAVALAAEAHERAVLIRQRLDGQEVAARVGGPDRPGGD